ncbi:DMT family transporter [Alphaproteobacteria bacterium]|jgi:drug/metabolite transporter (DMT)-like permease|nr:DMT family transporter [Alphaproteobacteria bacterium]MDB3916074.1 DMT family transporter [Alphaproteobacteria bacterium]
MANKDWLLVSLLGLFWGSSFFFVEVLLKYLSPFMIVYLRVSIASIFLILFIYIKGIKFQFTFNNFFNLSIMSLLNNIFPFLLITFGQQTTTGGLASILNANTSFVAIILASLFLPLERLNLSRVVGISIGILGVVIAVGYQNIFELKNDDLGKYLIIIATISYGFAGVWGKLRLQNFSPIIAATGMLTVSTIILTPYAIINHLEEIYSLNFYIVKYAFVFAIICSVFAYFLYFKILESAGAGNLLICTIIIPPSSIFLNAFFLDQNITTNEYLGLIVIILGLIILDGRLFKKIIH